MNRCSDEDYVDLVDLINELKRYFASSISILSISDKVLDAYQNTLITTAGTGKFSSKHGMSIYLPQSGFAELKPQYQKLNFIKQSPHWLTFLGKLWEMV
jgi:hypothetical protein